MTHLLQTLLLAVSALSFVASAQTAAAENFQRASHTFFQAYCFDCHDSSTKEGGLDLVAHLRRDLSDEQTMATWVRIHDRIKNGEMPPKDADVPSDLTRGQFVKQIALPISAAHAKHKGTVLRRLNRKEYENTLNDMFGTNLKLAEMLPPDGRSREFENVGEALNMSMIQLRQYIAAMDAVLDASIAQTVDAVEPTLIKASYADTREGKQFIGKQWHQLDDGAVVFYQTISYPTGMNRDANTRKAGWYKIRVTGYAHQSDNPVTFSIGATTFQRGVEKPTFGYFAMPPGKPTTFEVTAWIEDRYMVDVTPYGLHDEKYEIKNKGIKNYKGPGLAINYVDLEGPLVDEFPSRGHKMIFTGVNRREIEPSNPTTKTKSWYKPQFEIISEKPVDDATQVLHRIAEHAFRRPVHQQDIASYIRLFSAETETGATFEEALRTAVTAIFCSPQFLYLQEPVGKLDDFALANRLSYFLTRTLPDEQLKKAANAGQFPTNPDSLRRETDRLLKSEHVQRFIVDFSDAWLNLRDIEFTAPDKNLFPEYDAFLLDSMIKETRSYFAEQVKENLSVESIVKSDFVMINNRLADLYGIEGVTDPQIRRVKLPKNHIRGGYLTHASILKVSANGTNTSPVVRGVWVLERIMGIHPPPPPAGVPGVEPDIRGASTLREILAKHRNIDSCRSCHVMIDPPGFALESFNPIGGWRDKYRSLGEGEKVSLIVHGRKVQYRIGPEVDSTGITEDGRTFEGFQQFREYLAEDDQMLTRTLVSKLLTFATGRELGFSDRNEVDRIVALATKEKHGIRDLIHDVVQSKIFRYK